MARTDSGGSDNRRVDVAVAVAAPGRSGLERACRVLVICWAVVGMAGCGYLFLSSAVPVTTLGDPVMWGPAWLQCTAIACAFLLGLLWLVLPAFLLAIGTSHLRAVRAAWPWQLGWVMASVAAVVLECLLVTGRGVPSVAPDYQGPAIVGWIWLAETAGCLAIGAAMLAVLGRAAGQ
jgi:hypothetical protein